MTPRSESLPVRPGCGATAPKPARTAIGTGLDVEPTAEILYRDWITLEHRRGNRAALARVINELQKSLRPLKVDMRPEAEKLITTSTPVTSNTREVPDPQHPAPRSTDAGRGRGPTLTPSLLGAFLSDHPTR
jgi:hypothetical protein